MKFSTELILAILAPMLGFMMILKSCDSANYQSCVPRNAKVEEIRACESILK